MKNEYGIRTLGAVCNTFLMLIGLTLQKHGHSTEYAKKIMTEVFELFCQVVSGKIKLASKETQAVNLKPIFTVVSSNEKKE